MSDSTAKRQSCTPRVQREIDSQPSSQAVSALLVDLAKRRWSEAKAIGGHIKDRLQTFISGSLTPELCGLASGANAAVADVIFSAGRYTTLIIVAALLLAPRFAACGGLALLAAWAAGRVIGFERSQLMEGSLLRNAFLTGLAAAWISLYWEWTAAKWPLLAVGGGLLGFFAAAGFEHLCATAFRLPPLNAGFLLAATGLWTIHGGAALADPSLIGRAVVLPEPLWLPEAAALFLKALGTLFFIPHALAGACVAAAVAIRSRLAFLMAIAGWAGGCWADRTLRFLAPWLPEAGIFGYNSILAGMALGACFFIPSWRSLFLAFFAGAAAIGVWHALTAFFSHWAAARMLSVPFLLTTWFLLAALRQRRRTHGLAPMLIPGTLPERAALAWPEQVLREPPEGMALIGLPFAGERTVTQGENGLHTHRGPWKHALDFEVLDAAGRPAPLNGRTLEAHYTYGSPVLSPVDGLVVRVINHVPDNPVGHHNLEQNWGNHLLLHANGGFHLLIAHFKPHGIEVHPGQRIAAGQLLGYCGNSGRSPLPHLHIQCQASVEAGSPTLPFRCCNYIETKGDRRTWHAFGMPAENARIEVFQPDPQIARLFQSWRTGTRPFAWIDPHRKTFRRTLELSFTENGLWRLYVPEEKAECYAAVVSGSLRLFGLQYESGGLLYWIAVSLSRVPFTRDENLRWTDRLPRRLARGLSWLSPFTPGAITCTNNRCIPDADSESIAILTDWHERGARSRGSIHCTFQLFRGITRLAIQAPEGTYRAVALSSVEQPESLN